MHPVCTHYGGDIDGFNITAPPDDVATTTPTPMEVTTSTPSIATTISTLTTPITGTTLITTPNPIPDTTTGPLSVYFVLKGSA